MSGPVKEAIMAVILKDGRFLIIRRGPKARAPGHWGPLSGTIELGETQEMALVREVKEEIGLTARPVRKVWECPSDTGEFLLHWWMVEIDLGQATLCYEEVSEVRWVTEKEYFELDKTFRNDREFFR